MSAFTTPELRESKSGHETARGVLPKGERIGVVDDEEIRLRLDRGQLPDTEGRCEEYS